MSSRSVRMRVGLTLVGALGAAGCGGTERQFGDGMDDAARAGDEDGTSTPDVRADGSAGDAGADTASGSDARTDAPLDAHPDAVTDVGRDAPAICAPGTYRCTGSALEACAAGADAWVARETCASDVFCDAAGGQCVMPTCAIGDVQCAGAAFQTCAADRKGWTTTQTCATDALCSAAGCATPSCDVGQYQCANVTLRVCNAGRTAYQDAATCSSAAFCDAANGRCNVCTPSATSCAGYVLHRCASDGQADNLQTCTGTQVCNPAGSCDPGCTNIAPAASASFSGGGSATWDATHMNNGLLATNACDYTWVSDTSTPGTSWIQLNWQQSRTVGMIHIDTSNITGSPTVCTSGGFGGANRTLSGGNVQWWNGGAWVDGGTFSGKTDDFDFVLSGAPVVTTAIRIYAITCPIATSNNSIIHEWYVYGSYGCSTAYDP